MIMNSEDKRDWLIQLRLNNHLSQRKAAALADMTQQHLSGLESTAILPSIFDAYALADIYHVDVDDIYKKLKEEKDHRSQKKQLHPRKWFTELRENLGLSKRELGFRAGVDQRTIANIEKGMKVNPKTAERVAAVLDFDPARLYNDR